MSIAGTGAEFTKFVVAGSAPITPSCDSSPSIATDVATISSSTAPTLVKSAPVPAGIGEIGKLQEEILGGEGSETGQCGFREVGGVCVHANGDRRPCLIEGHIGKCQPFPSPGDAANFREVNTSQSRKRNAVAGVIGTVPDDGVRADRIQIGVYQ